MTNGIDVSKWQGDIDWNAVKKSGVQFAIIRAGYGREVSQVDPKFEQNYTGAKKAGIPVGAYWYSYATNRTEAKAEAAACLKILGSKSFEYPIFYDVEEAKSFPKADEIIVAFCEELEKHGYFVGLYMSRYYLQRYVSQPVKKRYALWVAEYGDKLNFSGAGIWQSSSEGKVKGINGNVDLDIAYVDYPSIMKKTGLNKVGTAGTAGPVENKPSTSGNVKPAEYTVQKGDTLTAIAKKYKTTIKKLVALNGIKDPDKIYAGQVLKLE